MNHAWLRLFVVAAALQCACPQPAPRTDPRARVQPPTEAGVVLVLANRSQKQKTTISRFTPVRLLPDGHLVQGKVREFEDRERVESDDPEAQDFPELPADTHDDRYLYRVEKVGKALRAGSCLLWRFGLFEHSVATIPLPTTTCPTALRVIGGRVFVSAKEPGYEGRTRVGELLPPGAPTRVEWFHTSFLKKPNDFLTGTDRTLVAVDNMIYPKYATVYDLTAPGRPRYRYTAQVEDSQAMGPSFVGAVATDDTLFIRTASSSRYMILAYAITPDGLVPRAMLEVSTQDWNKPPDQPDTDAPAIGHTARLGDRLVFVLRGADLAHVPVTVRGGWEYHTARGGHGFGDDESKTVGSLCDDARGKWACRRVDLAKMHPTHVAAQPNPERASLGLGEIRSLTVRRDRGFALATKGSRPPDLVVLAWDAATRKVVVKQRVRLALPVTELVD